MKLFPKTLTPAFKLFSLYFFIISFFSFSYGYLETLSQHLLAPQMYEQQVLSYATHLSNIFLIFLAFFLFFLRTYASSLFIMRLGFFLLLGLYGLFLGLFFPWAPFFSNLVSPLLGKAREAYFQEPTEGFEVYFLFHLMIKTLFPVGQTLLLSYVLEKNPLDWSKKYFPFLSILPLSMLYISPKEFLSLERLNYSFSGFHHFSYFSFLGTSLIFNLILFLILFGLQSLFSFSEDKLPEEKNILSPARFIFLLLATEFFLSLAFLLVSTLWWEVIRIEYPNILEWRLFKDNLEQLLQNFTLFIAPLGALVVYLSIKYLGFKVFSQALPLLLGAFGCLFFISYYPYQQWDEFTQLSSLSLFGEWFHFAFFSSYFFLWIPFKGFTYYLLSPCMRLKYRLLLDFPLYFAVSLLTQLVVNTLLNVLDKNLFLTSSTFFVLFVGSLLFLSFTLHKLSSLFSPQ